MIPGDLFSLQLPLGRFGGDEPASGHRVEGSWPKVHHSSGVASAIRPASLPASLGASRTSSQSSTRLMPVAITSSHSPGLFHQASNPPAENASATARMISESQRWNRPTSVSWNSASER